MIVQFVSTETAEVLMFAEIAKQLLDVIGKESTARGVITAAEMPTAAAALREAVRRAGKPPEDDEDDEEKRKKPVISLGQRAWPLIDMLERTGKAGPEASIVWEAPADF